MNGHRVKNDGIDRKEKSPYLEGDAQSQIPWPF
jgi:hypothetical protein